MIVVVFADLNYSQFAQKEKRMLSKHLQGFKTQTIRKQSLPKNALESFERLQGVGIRIIRKQS